MSTKHASAPGRPRLLLSLIALVLLVGCRSSAPILGRGSSKEDERARRMTALVNEYTRDLDWVVQNAADRIAKETDDAVVGRRSVNWKLRVIPLAYEINREVNKTEAFVGLWVLTEVMHAHLTVGDGRDSFGVWQHIAVEAADGLRRNVRVLAKRVIDPEEFDNALEDVERYVAENQDYVSASVAFADFTAATARLSSWLPSINLEAFNPFSGLNESAEAIRYFTERAEASAHDLSQQLPWKAEALAYDLEQRETTQRALAGWEQLSTSVETIADNTSALPDDVQQIITTTLEDVDQQQEGLQLTIDKANTAIANADEALETAVKVTDGLNATAVSATEAAKAWDATFRTLGLVPPEEAPEPKAGEESRPFDIDEYRETAEALTGTAVELRGLVEDVETMASENGEGSALGNVERTVDASMESAFQRSRALVDHITVRLAQLLGIALLAGVLYRFVSSRLILRGRASP